MFGFIIGRYVQCFVRVAHTVPFAAYFVVESNGLDGPLPEEILTLNATESLIFFNNALSEGIPEGISSLTALKLLDVESNDLTGEFFTESILSLTEIVALRASFNELNGSIPEGIGELTKLEQLWVAENQIGGNLPTQFGNLLSLGTNPNGVFESLDCSLSCIAHISPHCHKTHCFYITIPSLDQSSQSLECCRILHNFGCTATTLVALSPKSCTMRQSYESCGLIETS